MRSRLRTSQDRPTVVSSFDPDEFSMLISPHALLQLVPSVVPTTTKRTSRHTRTAGRTFPCLTTTRSIGGRVPRGLLSTATAKRRAPASFALLSGCLMQSEQSRGQPDLVASSPKYYYSRRVQLRPAVRLRCRATRRLNDPLTERSIQALTRAAGYVEHL